MVAYVIINTFFHYDPLFRSPLKPLALALLPKVSNIMLGTAPDKLSPSSTPRARLFGHLSLALGLLGPWHLCILAQLK